VKAAITFRFTVRDDGTTLAATDPTTRNAVPEAGW